jgi:hypothetical protein
MSSSLIKGPSGHAKRKRAKEVAALIQSQRGDIHKFFRANAGASIIQIMSDFASRNVTRKF